MGLNVIITGVTGMVGEGVLHECLLRSEINNVLVVGRKPCGIKHQKLKEHILPDFFKADELAAHIKGYDACLFCLGVSSVGMKEEDYTRFTHTLTLHFANVLASVNPNMTFCYISGAGTDSSEKGRIMWARVKGKTENDLMNLLPRAYAFRPGYMQPTSGLKNTLKYYNYVKWMYPFLRFAFRGSVSTLAELGNAMINTALKGYDKKIVEVKDIVKLAKQN